MALVLTGRWVVGQTAELSTLLELSGPVYGLLSVVLVGLTAAGLVARREADVHRAVDLMREGSPLAVLYGVIAFGLVAFVGGYIISQLGRVTTRAAVFQFVLVLAAFAAVVLSGFGYLVVGTWLTELEGRRRPWSGAAIGAGLSAVPWIVLPRVPAVLGWILVAAVGLGSVTRAWVHGERTVDSEAGG